MKRFLLLVCLTPLSLFAQPEYFMSNMTVDDCEGFLYDSENGDPAGNYDHNENYTFSICVPGADQIVMNFFSFCTEDAFDSLRVYDGPDTLSTLIGTFMGEEDPPTLVATSGCMTLNFISDPNVSCTGWVAFWETVIEIPEPPDILPLVDLPCESNSLIIEFAEPVPCGSIVPGAFAITGTQSPNVISATPLDCVNGFATQVELTFNPMIDQSGNFEVTFTLSETICTTEYVLESVEPFAVTDCPLDVEIVLSGLAACVGDAATLIAEATGGDPNTYAFNWAPQPSNLDSIIIQPTGTTTYHVTVTDGNGAMATDSIVITPEPLPVLSIPDTILCQSTEPFILTANPPGGEWTGNGIAEGEEMTGLYDASIVPYLFDTIGYTAPNGCFSIILIEFIPLDVGTDDAACPGSAPFTVSGGLPAGGTWSGPNITPDGVFTPPATPGSFEVFYTHPNGCAGSKMVNVGEIVLPALDSVCQNEAPFAIAPQPFGGVWTGTGIIDADNGIFDPNEANAGDNQLIYEINGCSDTLSVFLKEIDAWFNTNACPIEDPFILPGNWAPMGEGVWSGDGIIDPVTGLYDPAVYAGNGNDTLYYTANGCTDSRVMFIRQTNIIQTYVDFCPDGEILELTFETVGRNPWGGQWTGPGVVNPQNNDFHFDPSIVNPGLYTIYYEANTCIDSMEVEVKPFPEITPDTFCILAQPAELMVDLVGGAWSGPGIIDDTQGTFDPELAGVGSHFVEYATPDGCVGTEEMIVTDVFQAEIDGLDNSYCFQDTVIVPLLTPADGLFTINGVPATNFNPATIGPGTHFIDYVYGVDECETSDFFVIEVGDSISVDLPFLVDSVCAGQDIEISAIGSGGSSLNNFTYSWDSGLGFGQAHFVSPNPGTSQTYTVMVEDGCSDPAVGSLTVYAHPSITLEAEYGPEVCFDDTTFVEVYAGPGVDFSYEWDAFPPVEGNLIEGRPGIYGLTITDNETGCQRFEDIQLPGFGPITANFALSPLVEGCLTTIDPVIQILDFSVGAVKGFWDFGDNSGLQAYELGVNLTHNFVDTGFYEVTLRLENEGGCTSEFSLPVCVEFAPRIFAPNAFTPNGDGNNDGFGFVGFDIESIRWQVYNRYGEMIYEGQNLDDRWDGKYKGNWAPSAVYTVVAYYVPRGESRQQVYNGFVTLIH